MIKRGWVVVFIISGLLLSLYLFITLYSPKPIRIAPIGDLPESSLDQRIYGAELILIGKVEKVLPSKWNTNRKIYTKWLSEQEIRDFNFGMFTDVVVTPERFLKGSLTDNFVLRVRSYTGKIDHVSFEPDKETIFQEGQTYLLLLSRDYLSVDPVDPGYFEPISAGMGTYLIEEGKATSIDGEWVVDDLVAYIEDSRWALTEPNIPENEDAKGIIKMIDSAYDIMAKAGYDFDTGYLQSVFVNAPEFIVLPEKQEYTRHFNGNTVSSFLGYMDYKTAFYNWWSEYLTQYDNIEWTEKWGSAWEREKSPTWEYPLDIVSIEIGETYTTVYLNDGLKLSELYLVKNDKNWYVAGEKGVTTQPEGSSTNKQ